MERDGARLSKRAVQEGLSEEAAFQLRQKEKLQSPEATAMLRKKKFSAILDGCAISRSGISYFSFN